MLLTLITDPEGCAGGVGVVAVPFVDPALFPSGPFDAPPEFDTAGDGCGGVLPLEETGGVCVPAETPLGAADSGG